MTDTPQSTRKRRKDARPGEILAAAFAEFAESGFQGTSMEAVAARAGIVKGTVYRYFPNKQALFEEAVRARILPILEQVSSAVHMQDLSPREQLSRLLRNLHRHLDDAEARSLIRILIAEGEHFPELLSFYHREALSRLHILIRHMLQRGVASGEFRASALDRMPLMLLSPALLMLIWQMTFQPIDPLDREAAVQAHLVLVLGALSPGPSAG